MSQTTVSVEAMDEGARSGLKRLILTLADSKRLMGIRYSDWVVGAPSIEAGIAVSSMAQDEWGHARLIYAMLKDLDVDPQEVEYTRPATAYASVGALDASFADWAAVVAGMVLVDGAITVALDGFCRGTFDPACSRIPKMLSEEEFHRSLGVAWYKRLAGSASEEAKNLLRQATEETLPVLLRWLSAPDAVGVTLAASGLTDAGAVQVKAFRDGVRALVATVGVDVDTVEAAEGWDERRGRGPGHPEEEAVERARGDRNRMLFVE